MKTIEDRLFERVERELSKLLNEASANFKNAMQSASAGHSYIEFRKGPAFYRIVAQEINDKSIIYPTGAEVLRIFEEHIKDGLRENARDKAIAEFMSKVEAKAEGKSK